jgi:Domain of unknown function (DUF4278)
MNTQERPLKSQNSIQESVSYTLIYRGHRYEYFPQRIDREERARSRRESLIGYPLIYRGNTYIMIPNHEPIEPVQQVIRTLIYRGVQFEKAITVDSLERSL